MLLERLELSTSPLPRECSTTELPQRWKAARAVGADLDAIGGGRKRNLHGWPGRRKPPRLCCSHPSGAVNRRVVARRSQIGAANEVVEVGAAVVEQAQRVVEVMQPKRGIALGNQREVPDRL